MPGKHINDFAIGMYLCGGVRTLIGHKPAVARNHTGANIHNTAVDLDVEQLPADGGELSVDGRFQRTAPVLHKLLAQDDEAFNLADASARILLLRFQRGNALFGFKPSIAAGKNGAVTVNDGLKLSLAVLIPSYFLIRRGFQLLPFLRKLLFHIRNARLAGSIIRFSGIGVDFGKGRIAF